MGLTGSIVSYLALVRIDILSYTQRSLAKLQFFVAEDCLASS